MSFRFRHLEKVVGIFTLIGLAIILLTVIFLGREQRWFESKLHLQTMFDSGENLAKGMNVTLNGLTIGHATGVGFTADNKILVTFTIYHEFVEKIRMDSYVFRDSSSPLGGGHLRLTLGTSNAAPVRNNALLLSQDSDQVQKLVASGVIPIRSSSLNQIVQNINQLTGSLASPRGALFSTLDNLQKLSASLGSEKGTLYALGTDPTLYNNLLQAINALDQITVDLRIFSTELRTAAPSIRPIVKSAEKGMNDTAKLLESLQRYFMIASDPSKPADRKVPAGTGPLTVIRSDRRDRE